MQFILFNYLLLDLPKSGRRARLYLYLYIYIYIENCINTTMRRICLRSLPFYIFSLCSLYSVSSSVISILGGSSLSKVCSLVVGMTPLYRVVYVKK